MGPLLSCLQNGQCFSQITGLIFKVYVFDLSLIVVLEYGAILIFFPQRFIWIFLRKMLTYAQNELCTEDLLLFPDTFFIYETIIFHLCYIANNISY